MFQMSERCDLDALVAFMGEPSIYWATHDRLSPQPEAVDWKKDLTEQNTFTFVGTFRGNVIGYVQFMRRTSVGAEMHLAFRENFRGRVAKTMTTYALAQAFKEKGLLKVWGAVPTDNRLALLAARHIGMRQEGVLTQAIVREEGGLRDLVLFGLTKEQFLAGQPPPRKRLNGAHP